MFCCKTKDDGASPVKKSKKVAKIEVVPEEGLKITPIPSKPSEQEGEPPKAMIPDPIEAQTIEENTKVEDEEANEIIVKEEVIEE